MNVPLGDPEANLCDKYATREERLRDRRAQVRAILHDLEVSGDENDLEVRAMRQMFSTRP